jgi:transient receptor potential cation channel subfamily A member 1
MLPFPFAGGNPKLDPNDRTKWHTSSLLHSIVKSNRTSLCGNVTVRTLVQYKWQTFGRDFFMKQMGLYCLGLLLLMTLLFIRTDPFLELNATDLLHGELRDKATFAIALVVILESLVTLSRECHEMSVIGMKNYFQEDWKNIVDLIVILLTSVILMCFVCLIHVSDG